MMRAKLIVESVQRTVYSDTLNMRAVYADNYPEGGADENNTFANFTPTANLEMVVNNPDLVGKFEPGTEFYVDFTLAEDKKGTPVSGS